MKKLAEQICQLFYFNPVQFASRKETEPLPFILNRGVARCSKTEFVTGLKP